MLCGIKVTNVTKEKHLGHVFNSEYCKSFNLINIDDVIRDMKVRTNTIVTHSVYPLHCYVFYPGMIRLNSSQQKLARWCYTCAYTMTDGDFDRRGMDFQGGGK